MPSNFKQPPPSLSIKDIDAIKKQQDYMEKEIEKALRDEMEVLRGAYDVGAISKQQAQAMIKAAKEPHYNRRESTEVPFVFSPVLQCPECFIPISLEKIDDLRLRLRHGVSPGKHCSRDMEEVIRPIADFVKFI